MADNKLAELLKTQKSLTEWLEDIKHKDTAEIRKEDNEKRERLRQLNEIIGLPFDKPTQFEAADISSRTLKFTKFLNTRCEELCALRLIPKKDGLPKLRMRGKSIQGAYEWFCEQDINPNDYRADFIPHPPDYSWATIFIVNKHGIQGEIIYGGHHLLTQGFHEDNPPMIFRYDFKKWTITPYNKDALTHLEKVTQFIHVPDKSRQDELRNKVGATFTHDYMEGYFETTDSSLGTWYIDYSRSLGKLYADAVIKASVSTDKNEVVGQTGSSGKVSGPVCIVSPDKIMEPFTKGSILVCEVTTPDYVPLMQKAAAIVTDQGGVLSHAAIVARELQKPCIVGTGNATKILKSNQLVSVDADAGVVSVINDA